METQLVKSLSELKEKQKIFFTSTGINAEVLAGKINKNSLMAQPLEARIITLSPRLCSVKTKDGSFFDLDMSAYVLFKEKVKVKRAKQTQANLEKVAQSNFSLAYKKLTSEQKQTVKTDIKNMSQEEVDELSAGSK